jgi:purine-nucleoside phosphorylase
MVAPHSPTSEPLRVRAREAADALMQRLGARPRVAMMLGTGHTSISGQLKNKQHVRQEDMPSGMRFAQGTPLITGELEGVPVVLSDAPLSSFEGHAPAEVTFPVRVLHAMGAELLILTAGAASLTRQLEPGTIAVVEDHINMSGIHPLQGPNDELLGPRFPDMSDPYTAKWRERARSVAAEVGISLLPGVFAAVPGPSLPTLAEYRFLHRIGADLVGMSLVPEVLAAVHSGFEVLALVGVTQHVHLETRTPVSIEDMLDAADLAAPRMGALLTGIVRGFAR